MRLQPVLEQSAWRLSFIFSGEGSPVCSSKPALESEVSGRWGLLLRMSLGCTRRDDPCHFIGKRPGPKDILSRDYQFIEYGNIFLVHAHVSLVPNEVACKTREDHYLSDFSPDSARSASWRQLSMNAVAQVAFSIPANAGCQTSCNGPPRHMCNDRTT